MDVDSAGPGGGGKERLAITDGSGSGGGGAGAGGGDGKVLLAITNGDMDPNQLARTASANDTNSMTASDMSSLPSMSTRGQKSPRAAASRYYEANLLPPGCLNEENMLSPSNRPRFLTDTDDDAMAQPWAQREFRHSRGVHFLPGTALS